MSSGTFVIEAGLKRIGAQSVVQPANPESKIEGMNILNSMLQLWLSWGIDLGIVPLQAPGDELGEPLDTRNAIIDNLALFLSADFDNGNNIVSEQLRSNARLGLSQVKQLYRKNIIPRKQMSSTTPRGQGNIVGVNSRTFFRQGEEISG